MVTEATPKQSASATAKGTNPPSSSSKKQTAPKKVSFALGGLGGFNGHGVGFLKGAMAEGVTPSAISCTSGQIYFVWRYFLECDQQSDPLIENQLISAGKNPADAPKVSIEADIKSDIEKCNIWPDAMRWLDPITMAMAGIPGVCEPARESYFENLFKPYSAKTPGQFWDNLPIEIMNRLAPAHTFNPTRPAWVMAHIGATLAARSDCAVMFNAFDPQQGLEYLYVNEIGLKNLQKRGHTRYQDGEVINDTKIIALPTPKGNWADMLVTLGDDALDATKVAANSTFKDMVNEVAVLNKLRECVDNALWLYFYGFQGSDGRTRDKLDGAYHRQFIMHELAPLSDIIFSVRPQSLDWLNPMPSNALQVQNFTTQMWFNAPYCGETGRIEMINDLLANPITAAGMSQLYNRVDLRTIEYDVPITFFDYFVERESVYREGLNETLTVLKTMKKNGVL